MRDPGKVLILGAGPMGLGAAYRLQELGFENFTVIEGCSCPGGLASSHVDEKGFTWDVGGHVQFSHYSYYDDLLDRALGQDWLHHERESWVWIKGLFVPYPFQNNIHRLDAESRDRALAGLEQAAVNRGGGKKTENFKEWILQTFGEGIADLFLCPYNFKVWGYPLETMGIGWMANRVAAPDVERVRQNVRENRDDVSWGPNKTFRFPLRGGTGAIWQGVANLIKPERFLFGHKVHQVDLKARQVLLGDGRWLKYGALITSVPLDVLCRMCEGLEPRVCQAGASMVHSSVHILGVGLKGEQPDTLRKKCWMYFPEGNSPYYRVTVFSNYSPYHVPEQDGHWSLMAEVCESPFKRVNAEDLKAWTLQALRQDGLLPDKTEVVSFWHRREEYGYPTPFLVRDELLACVLPELERHEVYSRGRFGAWKYEVANQDHSCMQGVEVVNRLLYGELEPTLSDPDLVNSGVFLKGTSN